jgi:hypothetical protein
MPSKRNPLNLNKLQLRTLALLQILARDQRSAAPDGAGGMRLPPLPTPHGDHFHVGSYAISSRDASGFANPAVFAVLERKGLAQGVFPYAVVVTAEGLAYETGMAPRALAPSDH